MTDQTKTICLVLLFAAFALLGPVVMDGPSEIQAITDVQAEVIALSGGDK